MANNLIENRQIRVFISSTFRDMQDERDYLMKRTFPKLRKLAAERDVTLTELDLRWGITEEEAKSGKVVEICLREIENSIPFFIGIIGNRYGWIPGKDDIGENVTDRFNDVNTYLDNHLSVTEMEMQFGVLNRKEEDLHAYFYIKEQEDENVDEPAKLAELKHKVKESIYPSTTYSSVENLAIQVEKAFNDLLNKLFPEENLSALEKNRIAQRAFLHQLCQNYIQDEQSFQVIDEWIKDWNKHQLIITGTSGLGKSALLANWVNREINKGNSNFNIIYHFTGNGGSESNSEFVSNILCDEINDIYGWRDDSDINKSNKLETLFNKVATEDNKPLLIVIDAINQIADYDNAKSLNWLPIPPRNVKILFSTLEEDGTMEVFRNRHYPVYTLQPLDLIKREQLVESYLNLYSKKLSSEQVARIANDEQCKNTLVLKTLLDELINFGIFEKLDEHIDYYLSCKTVEDFYQSLIHRYEEDYGKEFIKHILSLIVVSRYGVCEDNLITITKSKPLRWSQFYCEFYSHITSRNGLLNCSHMFMRNAIINRYLLNDNKWEKNCRRELVKTLENIWGKVSLDELPYQYYLLHQYKQLFYFISDLDLYDYVFSTDVTSLAKYWNTLIAKGYSIDIYLEEIRNEKDLTESIVLHLCDFFMSYISNFDFSIEVLNLWKKMKGEKALSYAFYDHYSICYLELGNFKKAIKFQKKSLQLCSNCYGEISEQYMTGLTNLGYIYGEMGYKKQALKTNCKTLELHNKFYGKETVDHAVIYSNLAMAYEAYNRHNKALQFAHKALELNLMYYGKEHPDTITFYNNIGYIYSSIDEYEKALENQYEALSLCLSVYGENNKYTAGAFCNVGEDYDNLKDFVNALKYKKKSLCLSKRIYGKKNYQIALIYNSIGFTYSEQSKYKKALKYHLTALEIAQEVCGENDIQITQFLHDCSQSYAELGEDQLAINYNLKAADIIIASNYDYDYELSIIYDDLGKIFKGQKDYSNALLYFSKSLELSLKIGDECIEEKEQEISEIKKLIKNG